MEKSFAAFEEWTLEEETYWITAITSITNLGAMIGALLSGSFLKYGKLRGILILNVVLLIAIGICLTGNIHAIAFARFFWGLCAGSFSVYCPKYLAEFIPIELRGTLGGLNQLLITCGYATPAIMSVKLPADPEEALEEYPNGFFVKDYWRVIWAWPALLAILHLALIKNFFNFETPVELKV